MPDLHVVDLRVGFIARCGRCGFRVHMRGDRLPTVQMLREAAETSMDRADLNVCEQCGCIVGKENRDCHGQCPCHDGEGRSVTTLHKKGTGNMASDSVAGHRVDWFIDWDSIHGIVTCLASKDAPCRLVCRYGCEAWPCGHDNDSLIDNGQCNAVEWWDNSGTVFEFYDGKDRRPLRNGPINVTWDGETWMWTFAGSGSNSTDTGGLSDAEQ